MKNRWDKNSETKWTNSGYITHNIRNSYKKSMNNRKINLKNNNLSKSMFLFSWLWFGGMDHKKKFVLSYLCFTVVSHTQLDEV